MCVQHSSLSETNLFHIQKRLNAFIQLLAEMYPSYVPSQKLDVAEESIFLLKGIFKANPASAELPAGKNSMKHVIGILELQLNNAALKDSLWLLRQTGLKPEACMDPQDSSRVVEILTIGMAVGAHHLYLQPKISSKKDLKLLLRSHVLDARGKETYAFDSSSRVLSRMVRNPAKSASLPSLGLYASSTFFSYGNIPDSCEVDIDSSQVIEQDLRELMWASTCWSIPLLSDVMQTLVSVFAVDKESIFEFDLNGGGEALAHIAALCEVASKRLWHAYRKKRLISLAHMRQTCDGHLSHISVCCFRLTLQSQMLFLDCFLPIWMPALNFSNLPYTLNL